MTTRRNYITVFMLVNIGKHLRKVTKYIYFKVIMDRITLKLLNVDEVDLMAIRIKSILKTIAKLQS